MNKFVLVVAFLLTAGAAPVLSLLAVRPEAGDVVLVIGAPWDASRDALIARAGGRPVGPLPARFASLAVSDNPGFPVTLRQQGAWLVLDATRLAALCGRTTT